MQTARVPGTAVVLLALTAVACGGGGPVSPESGTSFQGVWDGQWQRTSCSETGGAQGFCSRTPTSGAFRVTLSQSGTEVQGTLEFAAFVVPVTGAVTGGTLSLSGQSHQQFPDGAATGRLSNWSTTRSGNTMNGSFTFSIVADNPAFGSQTVSVTLQNVTKTS